MFWSVTALLTLGAAAAVLLSPSGEGSPPRIAFIHLPVAVITFGACAAVFVASVGQLLQHKPGAISCWDRLGEAAGVAALVSCSLLLVTGMIWGKQVWGEWWMWSPRLTFSLVLWLLYAGYVGMRPVIGSAARRAQVSCVYGIVAFLDVPLVYLSVKLLPDVHPSSIELDAWTRRVLLLCTGAAVMLCAGFIAARLRSSKASIEPAPGLSGPALAPHSVGLR
jgi:heme exporter protein C